MPHKNFKVLDQSVIDTMCVRYRTGASVTDLAAEFALGRNKIIKTLKEHLGSEYAACARLARASVGQKVAPKLRGRKNPHTPEWNEKIGKGNRGKTHSEETKALISQRNKERELDLAWQMKKEEVYAKIVATKRKNGVFLEHSRRHSAWMKENAPMRGKKMSDETRAAMSARKKELIAQGWKPTIPECTDELRENRRQATLKMWRDGKFAYGDGYVKRSKLEKRVFDFVKSIHADAVHSHMLSNDQRTYCYDIYVPSLDTLIEVNGDFWHCNPRLMTESEWAEVRDVSTIRSQDEEKVRVATEKGHRCVTLWEMDLLDDFENVVFSKLVQK